MFNIKQKKKTKSSDQIYKNHLFGILQKLSNQNSKQNVLQKYLDVLLDSDDSDDSDFTLNKTKSDDVQVTTGITGLNEDCNVKSNADICKVDSTSDVEPPVKKRKGNNGKQINCRL